MISPPGHYRSEDGGLLPLVQGQWEHRRHVRRADLRLAAVEHHAESQPGAGPRAGGLHGNCPGGLVDDWRTGLKRLKNGWEKWWKHGGECWDKVRLGGFWIGWQFEIEWKFGSGKGMMLFFDGSREGEIKLDAIWKVSISNFDGSFQHMRAAFRTLVLAMQCIHHWQMAAEVL